MTGLVDTLFQIKGNLHTWKQIKYLERSKKTAGSKLETGKQKTMYEGEIEEILDDVDKKFNRFKNFDVIDYPPHDHHYYRLFDFESKKKMKDTSTNFSQRIQQELKVLEKNIPGWLFVRSYVYRTDLMRAAIIGPPNTPYHHCLFFFDIEFPTHYPTKPPKIHYQSYGLDLNPNLRLDGKITLLALSEARYDCLKQNLPGNSTNKEKWDPEESNLLHVFHAIRNTILSKLDTLEKNNRRVFVLTCQKMIRVLKEPPADFRDFVPGYFRKRAHSVLLIFRENKYNESLLMIDLFVRMFKVFVSNGAYCKHHLCFLKSIDQKNCRINVQAKIRVLEEI